MENHSLRPLVSSQAQGPMIRVGDGPQLPRPLSLLPWIVVSRQFLHKGSPALGGGAAQLLLKKIRFLLCGLPGFPGFQVVLLASQR